jgi:hypothetical protein
VCIAGNCGDRGGAGALSFGTDFLALKGGVLPSDEPKVMRYILNYLSSRTSYLLLFVPLLGLSHEEPVSELAPQLPEPTVEAAEFFVIEWAGESPHPATGYKGVQGLRDAVHQGHLGLAKFHRRQVAGGWQLEQEVIFPFDEIRLMAVECLSAKSPRLVWRELSGGLGRTLFAEWTAENERLRVLEWASDGALREYISTSRGAVMPQYLLELARHGKITAGVFEVFDPLRGGLDRWELETSYLRQEQDEDQGEHDPNAHTYRRQLKFYRSDGTLAGSYLLEGERLVSFQWQNGQVRAKRISADAFGKLEQSWGIGRGSTELEALNLGAKDL